MRPEDRGQLTLETVLPGKSEEAVVAYLAKLFKDASRVKLAASIKRMPLVLSRNVAATTADKIIVELEKLGARAVFAPNGSAVARSSKAKTPPKPQLEELKAPILGAFKANLPRVPVSGFYVLGLCLVAFAMLLLPVIYLGLIGCVGYSLYWHATLNSSALLSVNSARIAIFAYVAPVVVGGLLLLFMIKPLFVRRSWRFRPSKIVRKDEPLLFAFVEMLCRRVGAPMPNEIHLDTNVNASASFRRGLLSVFGNDLVLTIGLPLTGGLNLTQFAGVLAHEFGHFAQATGMRLTYIIRCINLWFERVVNEEDAWDERIRRWSQEWDFRVAIIVLVARLFIWLTRKILWFLMLFGHGISSFMLRQMEYDADSYETHLVGAEVFESTARRLLKLSLAYQWGSEDLGASWEEGRLVDNFPALVLANENQLPKDPVQQVMREHFSEAETGLFDTHPCDRDRIEKARELNAKPLFKLDTAHPAIREQIKPARKLDESAVFDYSPPASLLFRNFEALAKRVSLDYYRGVLGKEVMPKNLVSVGTMVKSQDEELENSRALGRFCQGHFSVLRPLGFSDGHVQIPAAPKETLQTIKTARQLILTSNTQYGQELKAFNDFEDRVTQAFQVRALLDAGFHMSDADVDAMFATFQEAEEGRRLAVVERMIPFEEQLRCRMAAALQLLTVRALAAKIENAEDQKKRAERFIDTANRLENQLDAIRDLNIAYQQLGALVNHLEGNEEDEKLVRQIRRKMGELRKGLITLKTRLSDVPYPFEHTKDKMTLAEFAIEYLPSEDELGPILEVAWEAMDKLFRVYARLSGRLARVAEMVEKTVGLQPLPEPPQPTE